MESDAERQLALREQLYVDDSDDRSSTTSATGRTSRAETDLERYSVSLLRASATYTSLDGDLGEDRDFQSSFWRLSQHALHSQFSFTDDRAPRATRDSVAGGAPTGEALRSPSPERLRRRRWWQLTPDPNQASWVSRLLFLWAWPLLWAGRQASAGPEVLPPLPRSDQCRVQRKQFLAAWDAECWRAAHTGRRPSLMRAVWRLQKWSVLVAGALAILAAAAVAGAPMVLYAYVRWYEQAARSASPSLTLGWVYGAVLLMMMVIGGGIFQTHHFHLMFRVGMNVRTQVVSAIQEHIFKLPLQYLTEGTATYATTALMSDAQRLADAIPLLHSSWVSFALTGTAIGLLLYLLGSSALVGVAVFVVFAPVQALVARAEVGARHEQLLYTNERARLTNELLEGMRTVKQFAWEEAFRERIDNVRQQELHHLRKSTHFNMLGTWLLIGTPSAASGATFLVYSAHNGELSPARVFAALAYLLMLRMPLLMLPMVYAAMIHVRRSGARIAAFLLLPTLRQHQRDDEHRRRGRPSTQRDASTVVTIRSGYFTWHDAVAGALDETKLPPPEPALLNDNWTAGAEALSSRYRSGLPGQPHEASTGAAASINAEGTRLAAKLLGHVEPVPHRWTGRRRGLVKQPSGYSDVIAPATLTDLLRKAPLWRQPSGATEISPQPHASAATPFSLHDINLVARTGELVVLAGAPGAGCSTLLHAILGEVEKTSGLLQRPTTVSCALQTPLILRASVRANIRFGSRFDAVRLKRTIDAVSLRADLNAMRHGSETVLDEPGTQLTAEQAQRLGMARALYATAELYLFDEPLSEVSPALAGHIYKRSLLRMLSGKTRIIATLQPDVLAAADRIYVLHDGRIVESGTFTELRQLRGVLWALQQRAGSGQAAVADEALPVLVTPTTTTATVDRVEETPSPERTPTTPTTATHFNAERPPSSPGPYAISESATDTDSAAAPATSSATAVPQSPAAPTTPSARLGSTRHRRRGHHPLALLNTASPARCVLRTLLLLASIWIPTGAAFAEVVWLQKWTQSYFEHPARTATRQRAFWQGGFLGLAIGAFGCYLLHALLSPPIFVQASRAIHAQMLDRVLRAPYAWYLRVLKSRILSRFARDLDVVDSMLPQSMELLAWTIGCYVAFLVLVTVFSPPLIGIAVAVLALVLFGDELHRRAARNLQQLRAWDSISMTSHWREVVTGMSTIRAFQAGRRFRRKLELMVDEANRTYAAVRVADRWLQLMLETSNALLVMSTAWYGLGGLTRSRIAISVSEVACVLYLGLLGGWVFNWGARMTAETSMRLLALRRCSAVMALRPEDEMDASVRTAHKSLEASTEPDWPSAGAIQVHDLHAVHPAGVGQLRGVSLCIEAGMRVGVVPRGSCAGHSLLPLVLFRFVQPSHGSVLIDKRDIASVPARWLRPRLGYLPAAPKLFSGSWRFNLDPLGQFSDAQLWSVLRDCALDEYVRSQPGALDAPVDAAELDTWRDVHLHLVSVARVKLHAVTVLVLENVTEQLHDPAAQQLLHRVIERNFGTATRLHLARSVAECTEVEVVLEMEDGEVVAEAAPLEWLDEDGHA